MFSANAKKDLSRSRFPCWFFRLPLDFAAVAGRDEALRSL
jgi:hypothetical protein